LEQIGFSIEILLFLDEIRIRVGNGRLGRFQGRLVIGRIDFKQKITGLDLLIVVDRNVDRIRRPGKEADLSTLRIIWPNFLGPSISSVATSKFIP
jgi:hypothetical protein